MGRRFFIKMHGVTHFCQSTLRLLPCPSLISLTNVRNKNKTEYWEEKECTYSIKILSKLLCPDYYVIEFLSFETRKNLFLSLSLSFFLARFLFGYFYKSYMEMGDSWDSINSVRSLFLSRVPVILLIYLISISIDFSEYFLDISSSFFVVVVVWILDTVGIQQVVSFFSNVGNYFSILVGIVLGS